MKQSNTGKKKSFFDTCFDNIGSTQSRSICKCLWSPTVILIKRWVSATSSFNEFKMEKMMHYSMSHVLNCMKTANALNKCNCKPQNTVWKPQRCN